MGAYRYKEEEDAAFPVLLFEFEEGSPVKNGSVLELVLLEDSEDDMFRVRGFWVKAPSDG